MTTANMLSRVRTSLDEASASFWTDAEIYSALTDGQQETANYFLSLYKAKSVNNIGAVLPQPLESLLKNKIDTTVSSGVTKPTDYWHLVSAKWAYTGGLVGTYYPCRIEGLSSIRDFNLANTYLAATETFPTVYEAYSGSAILFWFLPAPSGTGAYNISYISVPTTISSSVDPILPASTHTAIVHWAVAQMLSKDQRPQEAQLFMQNFINEIQVIG